VRREQVTCCIAGGGPAGIVAGLLLARQGVDVLVLEKHADFLRDFRGDTLHPSTLEVIGELGLVDALLALPHQKVPAIGGRFGDTEVAVADFSRLPVKKASTPKRAEVKEDKKYRNSAFAFMHLF
jgi:2-polyprenyl-6-methoxyphenol hydroxylase-like FAD-dependent oxidoreductase